MTILSRTLKSFPSELFLLLSLVFFLSSIGQSAQFCAKSLSEDNKIVSITPPKGVAQIPAEEIKILRFMNFNVENFFLKLGHFDYFDGKKRTLDPKRGVKAKKDKFVKWIARIIDVDVKPDVIAFEEIDKEPALDKFNREEVGDQYDGIVITGNDTRGIQVGSNYNNRLPINIEVRTNVDMTWVDKEGGSKQKVPLFSRDAPVSILRLNGYDEPLLITIVLHNKSKRSRPNDHESNRLRTAQMAGVAKIIKGLQAEFGQEARIIVLGDMNTDVNKSSEMTPLKDIGFVESLNLVPEDRRIPVNERVTQTYHPRDGPTVMQQLDGIFLSPSLQKYAVNAEVYRYRTEDGQILPIPKTFKERSQQPSDHFPIFVDIDFQEIIKAILSKPKKMGAIVLWPYLPAPAQRQKLAS